ncbi:hypothetical protein E2C01_088061 [Portunus trituberculatus]|uniref:Uncharacterized protein n=1 Tax=Portunus trituberculatus TaxID=210409 RepID=A0A5B7JIV3_PORTR|nr:hypothetical protein [Portunus trituberculatus]
MELHCCCRVHNSTSKTIRIYYNGVW